MVYIQIYGWNSDPRECRLGWPAVGDGSFSYGDSNNGDSTANVYVDTGWNDRTLNVDLIA